MDDPIADVALVRGHLIAAAAEGRAMSYAELLGRLGHRFSRPKLRALCATLTRIDEAGALAGEPGLAVLVVRAGDGLPGQGWWTGGRALALGHDGGWTGPRARALVERQQRAAYRYWRRRASRSSPGTRRGRATGATQA